MGDVGIDGTHLQSAAQSLAPQVEIPPYGEDNNDDCEYRKYK